MGKLLTIVPFANLGVKKRMLHFQVQNCFSSPYKGTTFVSEHSQYHNKSCAAVQAATLNTQPYEWFHRGTGRALANCFWHCTEPVRMSRQVHGFAL